MATGFKRTVELERLWVPLGWPHTTAVVLVIVASFVRGAAQAPPCCRPRVPAPQPIHRRDDLNASVHQDG